MTLVIEMLRELESCWRAQGAPIADSLQPGLSDAEMDDVTQPRGLELPAEARVWWAWHNGAAGDGVRQHLGPLIRGAA